MTEPCISIILPVYNEDGNIAACLRGLTSVLQGDVHEILVCYDFDEDKTLPAIEAMPDRPPTVRLVRNTLGRGVAFAIRAGLQAARGDVLVTTMADLSDPPEVIPLMARKIREEGADVVSGSRYMKGGSQTGGPGFKVLLSRSAGLSLRWLAGLGTHDATTNFRAYGRRYIDQVRIESVTGFELGLELTAKAHLRGFKVDEVPSTWKDRSAGESRFKLWAWLPRYLRWYLQAMAEPLVVWTTLIGAAIAALLLAVRHGPVVPYLPDEWMYVPEVAGRRPMGLEWLFSFHNEHRIPLPKLIWALVERASGFDGRWGSALNALFLAVAALLVLLGIRRHRGRMAWTDAAVPLLLLHGGHWGDITWPFQVAFTVVVVLLAWIVSRLLSLKREADPGLAAGLFLLPFCGPATFPFVALLAPWTIWRARRDPRPAARRLTLGLAAGALLLLPIYFGFRRPEYFPPSPGVGADLRVALQLFANSMGIAGSRHWPISGGIAAAALAASVVLLLRGRRPQATGTLLVLIAFVALSLMIGHSRSGLSPHFGFDERYITLFGLAPVLVYVASGFLERTAAGRFLAQGLLVLGVGLLYPRNGDHAEDRVSERRYATDRLLQDVVARVPIPILARRHPYWSPQQERQLEEGFAILAQDRLSVYRDAPAPLTLEAGGRVPLPDGRIAIDLSTPALIDLPKPISEVVVDAGLLQVAGEPQAFTLRLVRDNDAPREIGTGLLSRESRSAIYRVDSTGPARLEIRVRPEGNLAVARPWMLLTLR